MVCNHCGAPLEPGMRICPRCGYSLDSNGISSERTATHRPQEGRTNTRNRDAFMAATSAHHPSVDRATPVRADGNPCLYCGTIIPEGSLNCPKCGKSVSGKAPSISGSMPPVPKTPRQSYEAHTGKPGPTGTRASMAATAAYAAMAQKMGYDTKPRQVTGEIPPVSAQGSGKIPAVTQGSGKIPPVSAQGSGKIPVVTQGSGKIPAVSPQTSGKFPAVSTQGSGKIPVVAQGSGKIPPVSAQDSGKIPAVTQGSGKIPSVALASEEPTVSKHPVDSSDQFYVNQDDPTAVLPPLTEVAIAESATNQAETQDDTSKNPYSGAHAKPAATTGNASTAHGKKHPTKAKTPLSTTRQQTIGVAPITSNDLTNEEQRSKRRGLIGVGIITCVLAAGVGIGAWWFNGGEEKEHLVDYIETLSSFNSQKDNPDSDTPFSPTNHSNTGGTSTKSLDDDTDETKKESSTKTNTTDKTKTTSTKNTANDKDDKDDDDDNKDNNSESKTKVTNTTANNSTTNSNRNQSSSSNNNTQGGSTNTWSNPSTSNNNYGSTSNSNSSTSNSSSSSNSSIWPDDLNNPPYQYYPPNPNGGSSWGSGNTGGNSSWGGNSGNNGSYNPPLGELETEADKALKAALADAKARLEDYILPESADRDYLRQELEQLTDFELYLARNEIYARHGRIFNVKALDEYFQTRKWYDGKYTGAAFEAMGIMLNEFETRNAELIKEIERERNSPYLSE